MNTASSRFYAGATGPGLSAMFEAPEEGYAADTPARVHSGFLIRVPMDTRKTSIWTGRGFCPLGRVTGRGGPDAIGPWRSGFPRTRYAGPWFATQTL